MYISRRLVGTVLIALFLIIQAGVTFQAPYYYLATEFAFAVFCFLLFLTYLLMGWVANAPQDYEQKRQRRIKKLLNELDDNDLDLLRERLMETQQQNEYESLEAVLNHQKHKR